MIALGFLLAALIGVALGFFGGGGSILTVPLLVYVFGLEARTAIASSLLVVASASLAGAVQHWRLGNVRARTAVVFGAAGMAGAYLGGRIGSTIDGGILLLLFAATMLLTGVAMWRARPPGGAAGAHAPSAWRLVRQGFAVGSFTGLVGAGGGFLIVPALVLWAGLPPPIAIGTSLVVIVLQTLAGFAGYAATITVDYRLVAGVAATAIAGSFLGVRIARIVPPAALRRAFASFVMTVAVVMLVRQSALVLATGRAALPTNGPQVAFALAMLAVGVLAGRASRGGAMPADEAYEAGEGI